MRHLSGVPRALVAVIGIALLSACSTAARTPATSRPPASDAPSRSAAPSDAPSPTPETTHVVRVGETLASIARAYGTTIADLQAWNSDRYPSLADEPGIIESGWELVVSLEPGVTPRPAPSTPAPTAAPTPTPAPTPAGPGCTAGNRVAPGAPQTFRAIPDAGPAMALTFDMGGRLDPAVDIMDFLVANEVCATIFATGAMSQTPQGQQVLALIGAHPELFEIANHTMYHCDLVRGGGGSPSTAPCAGGPPTATRIAQELADAEAILRQGTGQDPRPYWRPPYGSISQPVLDAAAAAGYTKTFLWDIDTVDWKPIADGGPTAEQIASRVVTGAANGSSVLFHLGGYETLEALTLIVPGLRDRGMTLTSLSDLLD